MGRGVKGIFNYINIYEFQIYPFLNLFVDIIINYLNIF